MNKASGGDGIPVELFQILKDDAVKVLHSICQEIWKTQQWPQDWKRSVFIPITKKGNAKECSNYHTIALISHASKVMLRIFQIMVIHRVKGFCVVNKAEVDVFLELSCFFDDLTDVGNLISGSSAFSKSSLNIWKFMVHILWKPGLQNLSITSLACEMSATVR